MTDLQAFILAAAPALRNRNLDNVSCAGINGCAVLVDDILALAAIGLGCSLLHQIDRSLGRNDLRELEECGLQDGVDTGRAHAGLDAELDTIDDVELDLVIVDILLDLSRKLGIKLLHCPRAVQQEGAAVNQLLYHVEGTNVGCLVAGYKVRLMDEVGGLDRLLAEAQVGHGHAAGLLGIIIEVSLRVHIRVVADDLDGVLVRTDSTVSAETPELAADRASGSGDNFLAGRKGKVRDIIGDADREFLLLGVVIDRDDLCRRRILGTKTVTAVEDRNILELRSLEGSHDIQCQRLCDGAGFLGSVENGDLLDGIRNRLDQLVCSERSVQANLDQTNLAALRCEVIDGLLDGIVDGAHGDDDLVSIRSAVVIEQLVVRAEFCIDLVHVLLDDRGHIVVSGVACLTGLEEDVRVLCRTVLAGMVRIQSVSAECVDGVMIDHLVEVLIIPHLDLLNLVRGAEAVEEVDERQAALDGCAVSNRSQIHDFLDGRLAEHRGAGLTAGINIGMITEDVQSVGSNASCGDVEHAGKTLTGDLVKIRDHQKKTLGCGEGRGHRTGGQRAVHCTGSTGLSLHFGDFDGLTEDVLSSGSRPLIDMLRHNG